MASLTVENYVKTIYQICLSNDGEPASTGRLAASLNVSPGTVTSMLKTLSEIHLATYMPYEGVRLTSSGEALALRVLGCVSFVPSDRELWPGLSVAVSTDAPVAACLASQYAGWKVSGEKFFAMGSGPMRAAIGREDVFDHIGFRELATTAVGVLETSKVPPDAVCTQLAADAKVDPAKLILLVARTASQVGTVQIVARSVETALHKLHELKFDLSKVISGFGVAPLPPPAADDLSGIGRTNDAILYGGEVTLYVRGDDAAIEAVGPKVPSSASHDHGRSFAEIFSHYGGDFYKIDPLLFSPAVITFSNLDSGRTFRFGHTVPRVIHRSFMP